MRITFSGGTAQQREWVQQAVDACTYPFGALDVGVTVTWAPTTPCGDTHTYMCTRPHGADFVITIDSDADDPAGAEASRLPNPAGDVHDFYMESFIHELGHVVLSTLVNSDPLRTQIAGLFWHFDPNAGSDKRFGTLADYDTSTIWAERIVEAIAECFKVGWYTGRLVFWNRTNWNIDEAQWATFCQMLERGARYRIGDESVAENPSFDHDHSLWMATFGEQFWFNDVPFPLYMPPDAHWPLPAWGGGGSPPVWFVGNDVAIIQTERTAGAYDALHYQDYAKVTLHWDFSDDWFARQPIIGVNWYGEMTTWPSWDFYDLDWVTRTPGPSDGLLEGAVVAGILLPSSAGQLELPRRHGMDEAVDVGHRVDYVNLQLNLNFPEHAGDWSFEVGDFAALQNSVWLEFGDAATPPYPFGGSSDVSAGPAPAAVLHHGIPPQSPGLRRGVL